MANSEWKEPVTFSLFAVRYSPFAYSIVGARKETPMKTWFFTEDAYPYLPDPAEYESIRVNLPNRHYDPVKGADLYHMYLDMWLAAEGHGLEIMVNEHHQTATCVVPAAPLLLAILARQSKTARSTPTIPWIAGSSTWMTGQPASASSCSSSFMALDSAI